MGLVLSVILFALIFEYVNGFHDTANSIATVVSTKVLTPRQAIIWAAFFNLAGALTGTAVATTIGKGLVDTNFVDLTTVLSALLGAVVWNLLTWWLALPSSSSHALVGGLCGATLASANGAWGVIRWSTHDQQTGQLEGVWPKVILPMFSSPVLGMLIGFVVMGLLLVALRSWLPYYVNLIFGKAQLFSAAFMGFSHGTNDAQKTMGILSLTMFTATGSGVFGDLPDWLSFLKMPVFYVPLWVKIICALTMAAGTAGGGWRIIRTLGHKVVRLQPIHGFAAETSAAAVIQIATHWGIPVSTTHIISTSIMGVGATKRLSAVRWGLVERMLWAWVLTLPVTGCLGFLFETLLRGLSRN
ncbi:MAG: inorganic phosphate transporter [Acidobacteria bacterium]|nr:MAG: inorganic phosphate transporter [Acidobacteriota bacterium]